MHTHTNALNMHYLYPNFLVQTQCGDSDSSELDSSCFEPDSVLEAEPRFKKFKYLSSVVSDKLKQQATSRASTPRHSIQEEQLDAYIGDHMVFDEKLDAIDFWIQNQDKYPDLAPIALDLLVIPATSTPIERVFSTAGLVTSGKRNRLSAKRLEREVMIKKNKGFL